MIIPYPVAAGYMNVFFAYTLIYSYGEMNSSTKVLFGIGAPPVFLIWAFFMLSIGGRVYSESKKTKREWRPKWRDAEEARYIRRLKKSFRPLWVEMPGFIKINHLSAFKFLKAVTRGIFRALLALK